MKKDSQLFQIEKYLFSKGKKGGNAVFCFCKKRYGTRTLSLEQLLAIERTYINIQKIRNTQKRLFNGMEG